MFRIVFVRHGESVWNLENRFTGWEDVDLSARGVEEARAAGRLLKQARFEFDRAFTSVLKRAIKTTWMILEEMDRMWIPITNSWRLNERHYGQLTGLNKKEMATLYGAQQVQLWRRSFDVPPPSLAEDDTKNPRLSAKYRRLAEEEGFALTELPLTECLRDTVLRVVPYWESSIVPALQRQRAVVLVAAHGNSIRALVKHIEGISDRDIAEVNIPTGEPLYYELDAQMKPLNTLRKFGVVGRYLNSDDVIAAKIAGVANQSAPGVTIRSSSPASAQ